MSLVSDALAEGLSVLVDDEVAGEVLTVLRKDGSFELNANVNRLPNREREMPGKIEFATHRELSEIEYKAMPKDESGATRAQLKVGESIRDQFGYIHRIIKAPTPTGHGFHITCEQSQ